MNVRVLIKTDHDKEIDAVQSVVNALERAGYDVLGASAGTDGVPQIIAAEPEYEPSPPGSGMEGLLRDVDNAERMPDQPQRLRSVPKQRGDEHDRG